jgi:hypothetical protein
MVVRSLDIEKGVFRPQEEGEEIFGSEFPYLSLTRPLMYLANVIRPDIAFAVNLLARHSAAPTRRNWTGGKQILRYLNITKDLGLFFKKTKDPSLVGTLMLVIYNCSEHGPICQLFELILVIHANTSNGTNNIV